MIIKYQNITQKRLSNTFFFVLLLTIEYWIIIYYSFLSCEYYNIINCVIISEFRVFYALCKYTYYRTPTNEMYSV